MCQGILFLFVFQGIAYSIIGFVISVLHFCMVVAMVHLVPTMHSFNTKLLASVKNNNTIVLLLISIHSNHEPCIYVHTIILLKTSPFEDFILKTSNYASSYGKLFSKMTRCSSLQQQRPYTRIASSL